MFYIILKSVACLALFMLFYKLVLEQSSAHQLKRSYLLMALAASLVIPFITFYNYAEPAIIEQPEVLNTTTNINTIDFSEVNYVAPIDYTNIILWSLYGLGVLIFAVKFTINLTRLLKQIKTNTTLKQADYTSVLIAEKVIPHTFFNYIFFNKTDYNNNQIPQEVLLHEATHAKQKHSLDILFIELLQIVFWFNPLLYFIKKDIRLNHEFLADKGVLNEGINTKNYQYTLLEYSTSASHNSLANAINYPTLKKRFKIMKTQNSKRSILWRTFLIAPLLALLVFSFSQTETIQKTTKKTVEQEITVSPFKIHIKKENNKVYFMCGSGCDWETLTFWNKNPITYFSESGIEHFIEKPSIKHIKASKYLFSLKYTDDMFYLEGLKGTAWLKLSTNYKDGNTYSFNELGMGDNIEVPIEPKIEILSISQNPLKLKLNNKETSLDALKSDFEKLGLVNSEILKIKANGAVSMKLVNRIQKELKGYIKTITLSELAYLEDAKIETEKDLSVKGKLKSLDNVNKTSDYGNEIKKALDKHKTLNFEKEHLLKLTVNGIPCNNGCRLNFTRKQLESLILGTSTQKEITEFKFKVPGFPTQWIKDNKLNKKAIDFLNQAKIGDIISLFIIKSGTIKFPPVIITLVNKDSKNIDKSPVVVKGAKSSIPTPETKSHNGYTAFKKYLNSNDLKNAKIYYIGKLITKEKAIQIFKKDGAIDMTTQKDKNGIYVIKLSPAKKVLKGEKSNIPPPKK